MLFNGDKLRQARNEKGLSLQQLESTIGISKTELWQYENRDRQPSIEVLALMAKTLSISPADLLDITLTLDETINHLIQHNEWRRGGEGEQINPTLLGAVIDNAITELKIANLWS